MTVLSRGAKNRRGGRRPGWLLLTVLLVLAIAASSALVFTDRVELLKLAVILSLWAAVIGAFVSVMYRRQSDIDAARARDLKLVYDLQLDREISARREYELSVEAHLRRELASELRAQAADEVAALRSELAALRANLEILFDADLGDRPALEGDRAGDWTRDTTTMPPMPGRVESSRITPVRPEDAATRTAENPIIDVPEEPLVPPPSPPSAPPSRRRGEPEPDAQPGGSHRRASDSADRPAQPEPPFVPPPPVTPEPASDIAAAAAALSSEPPRAEPAEWRPVEADGRWLPPGAPGSNWVANADSGFVVPSAATQPPPVEAPRGRHWTPPQETAPIAEPEPEPAAQEPEPEPAPRPEPAMQPPPEPAPPPTRHSVEASGYGPPAMSTPPPPRHRGADEEPRRRSRDAEQTGGQSVAELLARLQANGTAGGGGRRRRRED